jgi:acetylornithine deacetylase
LEGFGMGQPVKGLVLDDDRFVALLRKLIGEAEFVQNNPPDLVPEEDRVVRHVLAVLTPHSVEHGGPLLVQHVTYVPGRGNVVVEYPGAEPGRVVSFVGMHMDVVTADPKEWVRDLPMWS